jgi:hypothetical protein
MTFRWPGIRAFLTESGRADHDLHRPGQFGHGFVKLNMLRVAQTPTHDDGLFHVNPLPIDIVLGTLSTATKYVHATSPVRRALPSV